MTEAFSSTCSQSMRTPVASTARRAALATSGPMPSPGIRVILWVNPYYRSVKAAAHIELAHGSAMVLEHAIAADFHGGGQLAGLDRKVAFEDFEFANLLEGGKLFVDILDGALHRLARFLGIAVDGEQRGDVGQAIADQQDLINGGLE